MLLHTLTKISLGVHLVPLRYVKPRATGKTLTTNLYELRNDMPIKVRLEIFWTMKISKILQKWYAEQSKVKVGKNCIDLIPKVKKW